MTQKPSKLQPALLGGLVIGLGSVIPIVSYVNFCCCGWGIVGGALAAYLLIKRSPVLPVTKGEGAGAGALAGIVGSLVYLVIGIPWMLLQWNNLITQMEQRSDNLTDAASREMMNQMIAMMQNHPVVISLVVWIMFAVVAAGAAALGGVIGVAVFEKRKLPPYPPQPAYPPMTPYPSQAPYPAQAPNPPLAPPGASPDEADRTPESERRDPTNYGPSGE